MASLAIVTWISLLITGSLYTDPGWIIAFALFAAPIILIALVVLIAFFLLKDEARQTFR